MRRKISRRNDFWLIWVEPKFWRKNIANWVKLVFYTGYFLIITLVFLSIKEKYVFWQKYFIIINRVVIIIILFFFINIIFTELCSKSCCKCNDLSLHNYKLNYKTVHGQTHIIQIVINKYLFLLCSIYNLINIL